MTFALAVIIGILVLGVLVFVHELGHFLVAKACKINVLTFSLGFGPSLLKKTWKGTEYRISVIPFGGYVRMAGENPEEDRTGASDEFSSKPIWQRALVALAGPVFNFVFAILFLWFAFMHGVERPLYLDSSIVGAVSAESPAHEAGFMPGDKIISINGETIDNWETVENRLGQQLKDYQFVVERDSRTVDLHMQLKHSGPRIPEDPFGGLMPPRLPPVVGVLYENSVAKEKLQIGDTILSVDGQKVLCFEQFSMIVGKFKSGDNPFQISIKRENEIFSVDLTPKYDTTYKRHLLGIQPSQPASKFVSYSAGDAVPYTMSKTWEYTTMIFDVLGKLFSREVSPDQLAGPLGIIPASGLYALQGLSSILNFMALVGINLAVLNLMPLVITDGGLLMFMGIEAIRGKPLSIKTQALINKIALFFFLALFIFVSKNDIQRLPDFLKIFK